MQSLLVEDEAGTAYLPEQGVMEAARPVRRCGKVKTRLELHDSTWHESGGDGLERHP